MKCHIFSRAKAEKFMDSTPYYTVSLVEILERMAVAAWNTADQHFHEKYQDRLFL